MTEAAIYNVGLLQVFGHDHKDGQSFLPGEYKVSIQSTQAFINCAIWVNGAKDLPMTVFSFMAALECYCSADNVSYIR